jgi:saccharopine dehydrogenase (NAD+, L-lysine forming)
MAESNSWPKAPKEAIIFGLKELPLESEEMKIPNTLDHTHIYFAHCFKGQSDWRDTMKRFIDGNSELFDLEFLQDSLGRRVAAFGRSAGFAGMAVGLLVWCHKQLEPETKFLGLTPYKTKEDLISHIQSQLEKVGKHPKILVLGALGRCGKGSVEVCKLAGVDCIEWDLAETKKGGPFEELLDVDVLVNDIYLMGKIPPFLTLEMIKEKKSKLSVLVDVSCGLFSIFKKK